MAAEPSIGHTTLRTFPLALCVQCIIEISGYSTVKFFKKSNLLISQSIYFSQGDYKQDQCFIRRLKGYRCGKKIFLNFYCLSTILLHEKPPPSFMQIKLYFAILVRHIGSAILSFWRLTPDPKPTTRKTPRYRVLCKSDQILQFWSYTLNTPFWNLENFRIWLHIRITGMISK